jgi:hypothetical protein
VTLLLRLLLLTLQRPLLWDAPVEGVWVRGSNPTHTLTLRSTRS